MQLVGGIPLYLHNRPKPVIDWSFMKALPSVMKFSRAGNATYVDENGYVTWAPANMLPNGDFTGAVKPSRFPDGWVAVAAQDGITVTVEDTGYEDGTPYVDIRYAGTANNTSGSLHVFAANYSFPASLGQSYTMSLHARHVGGSLAGVASVNIASREYANNTGLGASFGNTVLALTTTKTRFHRTYVCVEPTITQIRWGSRVVANLGETIDVTIRYYQGMMERTSYNSPSPYIPTRGSAYYGPRFDHDPVTLEPLGLLIEGQRQNLIRNNTNVGGVAGSPGTLPTNWDIYTSGTGLTRTLSYGTEFGMPYVDVRLTGTPVGAGDYSVFFEGGLSVSAVQNEVFTVSLLMRISAGSLSNISAISVCADENRSSGAYLEGGGVKVPVSDVLPSSPQYYTRTVSNAIAAYLRPRVLVQGTVGQPMDITLRIYLPQMEKAPSASSRILTSGVAVTRAADSLSTTNIPWFNPNEGTMFVQASTRAASTAMLAEFNDNSFDNRITCGEISGGSTVIGSLISSAGIPQRTIQTNRALATDTEHRVAHSWKLNQRFAARNGVLGTPDTTADMPVGITRLKFGDIAGGSSQYKINGTLRSFKYWNRALSASELQRITT